MVRAYPWKEDEIWVAFQLDPELVWTRDNQEWCLLPNGKGLFQEPTTSTVYRSYPMASPQRYESERDPHAPSSILGPGTTAPLDESVAPLSGFATPSSPQAPYPVDVTAPRSTPATVVTVKPVIYRFAALLSELREVCRLRHLAIPQTVDQALDMSRFWVVAFALGGWLRNEITKMSAAQSTRA